MSSPTLPFSSSPTLLPYSHTLQSLSQLVALTSWSYPLHTLVSQDQINSLITFSCQHINSQASTGSPGSLEWGQRAVQCLLIDIIHHGEIKPYFESLNKPYEGKTAEVVEEKASNNDQSPTNKSPDDESKVEDKLPPHDEQELKKMEQMFNKAPLEVPQILLSCGEVEIPLNRRTWKGRKGIEQAEKEKKKKLQEAKEKGSSSKYPSIPEEREEKESGSKAEVGAVVGRAVEEEKSVKLPSAEMMALTKESSTAAAAKVKDMDTVIGLNVSDLKRYLKLTYLQGDFEHLVDFPPPEKHSYGLAMYNPLPPSLSQPSYTSYIISNSFDYRVHSSHEISAELELQQLAKKVYESVLHALLHARPTSDRSTTSHNLPGEVQSSAVVEKAVEREEVDDGSPFALSTTLLTHSIEQLLTKSLLPQSNLSLVSVLEFCSDLNSLLPISCPHLPEPVREVCDVILVQDGTSSSGSPQFKQLVKFRSADGEMRSWEYLYPFTVAPVSSKEILSLVFSCLLNTQTPSSKMWQVGISVLRTSLRYVWFFISETIEPMDINYTQLLAVMEKLFSSRVDAVELREAKTQQLLVDIVSMKFIKEGKNGSETWYGIYLCFELMVKLLERRFVVFFFSWHLP